MLEKVKEYIIKNIKWIILFICLIGFLALAEDVFNKEIMKGDIIGYNLVSTFLISDFATPIAKFITNFGGAIFLIVLTITLIILIKNRFIDIYKFGCYNDTKSNIKKDITKTTPNRIQNSRRNRL